MITDILNNDKKYITQPIVKYFSDKLSETQCSINLAFSTCIPTIFSGILINVNNSSTTDEMLAIITSKNSINQEFISNPENFYNDNEKIYKKGNQIVTSLFGNKIDEVIRNIKLTSGLQKDSVRELLDITLIITMATLGTKASYEGWKPKEILNYLIRNQNTIKKSTPKDIKKIIGIEGKTFKEKSLNETIQKTDKKSYWKKYLILAIVALLLIFVVKKGCSVIKTYNNKTEKTNTTTSLIEFYKT